MDEENVTNGDDVIAVVVPEVVDEIQGEILSLCAYPENVADLPETQIMQQRSILSKPKLEKYKREFFNAVCCLVGIEVGRMPTANISSVYQSCMTIYSNLLLRGGENLLLNTIGLFVYLPGATFPAEVLQHLVDFCSKEMNKESRAATKATKVVVTAAESNGILLGKFIFDTYSAMKTAVNNQYNPLYREPKSGENITGVLLQVRMTLFRAHQKILFREKLMRESKNLAEFKNKCNQSDRDVWITSRQVNFKEVDFDVDWYPNGWMIFCLCGKPAGNRYYSVIVQLLHIEF